MHLLSTTVLLLLLLLHSTRTRAHLTPEQCPYSQGPVVLCRATENSTSDYFLRLPINAKKLLLARIHLQEAVESVVFDESELDRRQIDRVESKEIDFVRLIDISDRKIESDAWYAVCVEFDAITAPSSDDRFAAAARFAYLPLDLLDPLQNLAGRNRCARCSVLRSDGPSSFANLLRSSWVIDRITLIDTRQGAVLKYRSPADMPFASAAIFARVIDLDARREVSQSSHVIKPRQQLFVRMPNTRATDRYAVITDIIPHDRNGSELLIDDMYPLILVGCLCENGAGDSWRTNGVIKREIGGWANRFGYGGNGRGTDGGNGDGRGTDGWTDGDQHRGAGGEAGHGTWGDQGGWGDDQGWKGHGGGGCDCESSGGIGNRWD